MLLLFLFSCHHAEIAWHADRDIDHPYPHAPAPRRTCFVFFFFCSGLLRGNCEIFLRLPWTEQFSDYMTVLPRVICHAEVGARHTLELWSENQIVKSMMEKTWLVTCQILGRAWLLIPAVPCSTRVTLSRSFNLSLCTLRAWRKLTFRHASWTTLYM